MDLYADAGVRSYGGPPYQLAVVHGGPGAPGSAAGAARALADQVGVVEPLQSARSLGDQIEELAEQLRTVGNLPMAVLGHSWGATLSYLLAARYPELVRVLILVGGMFTAEAEEQTRRTRLSRLSVAEQAELAHLRDQLPEPMAVRRFDELLQQADSVAPIGFEHDWLSLQLEVKRAVRADATHLRDSGQLVEEGRRIRCPVLVLHGQQDPHPLQGVSEPLTGVVADLQVVELPQCGHLPWTERHARNAFVAHVVAAATGLTVAE